MGKRVKGPPTDSKRPIFGSVQVEMIQDGGIRLVLPEGSAKMSRDEAIEMCSYILGSYTSQFKEEDS